MTVRGASTPVTTAAGGFPAATASFDVAMVCCLGRRSRARLVPKEDCRNQGSEIFRRVLGPFLEDEEEEDDGPPAEVGEGVLAVGDAPCLQGLTLTDDEQEEEAAEGGAAADDDAAPADGDAWL